MAAHVEFLHQVFYANHFLAIALAGNALCGFQPLCLSGLDSCRRQRRRRLHQPLRVRVLRVTQNLQAWALFHDAAAVHHYEEVGALSCQPEIVSNKQQRCAQFRGELVQVIQDFLLHRDVEGGRWFVGNEQLRTCSQADRNERSLAHASRELVRVLLRPALSVRQAGFLQKLNNALVALGAWHHVVGAQRLLHLRTNAPHWVEVAHRVLWHQPNLAASDFLPTLLVEVGQVLAVKRDGAVGHLAGSWQQAQDAHRSGGLAGARLTHNGHGLAWVDRQVKVTYGFHHTRGGFEGDLEVFNVKQGLVHRFLAFGSRASRTTSPIMIKLSTVSARAIAG